MKPPTIFSRRRVNTRFVFGITSMVIVGTTFLMVLQRINSADERRIHTYRVLGALEHVLDALLDVETSTRGYALSGQLEYLAPYETGRVMIATDLKTLHELTSDNAVQQRTLGELVELADNRLVAARELVQARQAAGLDGAVDFVLEGSGKRIMDAVRSRIQLMKDEESRLMLLRDQTSEREKLLGIVLGVIGIAVATTLLISAFSLFSREHELLTQTESELILAKNRAEGSDRLKSAFLATMSHELRTPLNSIIGFTGIILQGLAGPLNPEQTKQLGMVRGSARHLLALINDVLDISKIEAGELDVASESFDLAASITHVVNTVRPLAEKKGLTLVVDITAGVTAVQSDKRRVEQVLLNLLSNAIKFTERGQVTLTAGLTGEAVKMQITDTGIGIKPEDLATLFKSFRQVDSGLSRNHEGTGLGLVICRRLAELMGGEIQVASEWGTGSIFTFNLPVAPANNP